MVPDWESCSFNPMGVPPWSSGSVSDHRSLPPVFESRRGHIWRLLHLWLRFITFGGRSAHLAYHVRKSGRKKSIIIIIITNVLYIFQVILLDLYASSNTFRIYRFLYRKKDHDQFHWWLIVRCKQTTVVHSFSCFSKPLFPSIHILNHP